MAASVINELLKPSRLDADPNSIEATKQFKHWLKIFTGFVEKCSDISQQQIGKDVVDLRNLQTSSCVCLC